MPYQVVMESGRIALESLYCFDPVIDTVNRFCIDISETIDRAFNIDRLILFCSFIFFSVHMKYGIILIDSIESE